MVAHDRSATRAVHVILSVVVILTVLAGAFALDAQLWPKSEHVGNGIVGGIIAGSIAIAMYGIDRRPRSREKKFLLAGSLCVELIGILDSLKIVLPVGGIGRPYASTAYCRAPVTTTYDVALQRRRRPAHMPDNPLQETAGMVYRGLANSGGTSRFEAAMRFACACSMIIPGRPSTTR